jgi:hypothetical protein
MYMSSDFKIRVLFCFLSFCSIKFFFPNTRGEFVLFLYFNSYIVLGLILNFPCAKLNSKGSIELIIREDIMI